MDFRALKQNLKKDFSLLRKIKIAVLSDSADQFLKIALRGYAYEFGIDFDIYDAPYNQIENEVLNPISSLYDFNPEFILFFQSSDKLQQTFFSLPEDQKLTFAQDEMMRVKSYYQTITAKNSACKIIFANFPETIATVFGNYANKVACSFEYQLRKLNLALMDASQELGNLFINDLSRLQNQLGVHHFHDQRMHINADMTYALDALPAIAKNALDIINASLGNFKKCLILDLDNTLWGGIIGDDGIENIEIGSFGIGKAFSEFQTWIKQLKQRGIILAICSQNHEDVAKSPFMNHPEMVLRLEDISIFVANWGSKAENIKHIQSVLNIGFNSMVFVDDDAYQRNLVRTYLPDVCVPDMPQDPADYLSYLNSCNLFETASYSAEDQHRGKYYQEESNRIQLKATYTTETDYLKNLEMQAEILSFNAYTLPRIAQLIQRSNQFNLRTIRYTEEQLQEMSTAKNVFPFAFSMQDKFGSYGIVSILILRAVNSSDLFIDTWIMSCRVLKRGLEDLALNTLVDFARKNGFKKLIGEFIPTSKNSLVAEHYKKMGFEQQNNDQWSLRITEYDSRKCYIHFSSEMVVE